MSKLTPAGGRRIQRELRDPYEGILFGAPGSPQGRSGRYSTLRTEDLEGLLGLLQRLRSEASKSVEFSDWPELQALVEEADKVLLS